MADKRQKYNNFVHPYIFKLKIKILKETPNFEIKN